MHYLSLIQLTGTNATEWSRRHVIDARSAICLSWQRLPCSSWAFVAMFSSLPEVIGYMSRRTWQTFVICCCILNTFMAVTWFKVWQWKQVIQGSYMVSGTRWPAWGVWGAWGAWGDVRWEQGCRPKGPIVCLSKLTVFAKDFAQTYWYGNGTFWSPAKMKFGS